MYENEDKLKSMYESAEAFFDEEDRSDGVWYQQTMIHAAVIQAEALTRIAEALERGGTLEALWERVHAHEERLDKHAREIDHLQQPPNVETADAAT